MLFGIFKSGATHGFKVKMLSLSHVMLHSPSIGSDKGLTKILLKISYVLIEKINLYVFSEQMPR